MDIFVLSSKLLHFCLESKVNAGVEKNMEGIYMKKIIFLLLSSAYLIGCGKVFGPTPINIKTGHAMEMVQGDTKLALAPDVDNSFVITAKKKEIALSSGKSELSFKKPIYNKDHNSLFVDPRSSEVVTADGLNLGLNGFIDESRSTRIYEIWDQCQVNDFSGCQPSCGPRGCAGFCGNHPIRWGWQRVEIEEVTVIQRLNLSIIDENQSILGSGITRPVTQVYSRRFPLTVCM